MPVPETIRLSSIPAIFNLIQRENTYNALITKLTRIFKESDVAEFTAIFLEQFKVALVVSGDVNNSVNRIFEFITQFIIEIAGLNAPDITDIPEENVNFFYNVFHFLNKYNGLSSQVVRKRICQFISKLLLRMSPDALLDVKICDMIVDMMKERIKDKVPIIRLQAILAVYRLQDKSDRNCPVTKELLEAIELDTSAEVRRLALSKISMVHKSIVEVVIDRISDLSEKVRKETYVVLSKLHIKQLTIEQRKLLLNTGLYDNNEIVRNAIKSTLLPAWLKRLDNKYLDLLKAIDLQINSMKVATKALMSLFDGTSDELAMNTLKPLLDDLNLISYEKLTVESSFFWRCYVFYMSGLVSEKNNYAWESGKSYDAAKDGLLPDLNVFCEYIKMYYAIIAADADKEEQWKKMEQELILIQLVELCKVYDYADEFGRKELKTLCLKLLKHVQMETIKPIIELYFMLQTNLNESISQITELINDLLYPNSPANNSNAEENIKLVNTDVDEVLETSVKFKIAQLEVELNELREVQEESIKSENFSKAEELKMRISEVHDKIQQLKVNLLGSCVSNSYDKVEDLESNYSEEEVGNPLENLQIDVIKRCLVILQETLHSSLVRTLTPELRTLFQMLVLPACKSDNCIITPLATEVLGSCCLRDVALAKEHFTTFFALCGNSDVCVSALKVIFDFLLLFSPNTFDIDCLNNLDEMEKSIKKKKTLESIFSDSSSDEESMDSMKEEPQEKVTEEGLISGYAFISALVDLLDDEFVEARFTVLHGLSQLMATGKLKSTKVLTRLILIWFHPASNNSIEIRDCLNFFFMFFARQCPWSMQLFENSFMPVMNTLFNAPIHHPFSGVDQKNVLKVLCEITSPNFIQENPQIGDNNHFNIAVVLCNHIMDLKNPEHQAVLLKGLDYLDLSYTDPSMLPTIKNLINKITKKFQKKNYKKLVGETKKLESKLNSLNTSKNLSSISKSVCLEKTVENCDVEEMEEY